jgi:hypothetical protein
VGVAGTLRSLTRRIRDSVDQEGLWAFLLRAAVSPVAHSRAGGPPTLVRTHVFIVLGRPALDRHDFWPWLAARPRPKCVNVVEREVILGKMNPKRAFFGQLNVPIAANS